VRYQAVTDVLAYNYLYKEHGHVKNIEDYKQAVPEQKYR